MCGRYVIFTSDEYKEMHAILKKIAKRYKTGEIFPSYNVPAVLLNNNIAEYTLLKWGMELYKSSRLVINAKSETINEKRMFKNLVPSNRCLLPANGFYEWKDKVKYLIKPENLDTFYMAGIYNKNNSCSIITTAANNDMKDIHNRMPVIFDKEIAKAWLKTPNTDLLVPYSKKLIIKKAV